MAKKIEELEQEIARLEQENERLDLENVRLLARNLLMSEQLNSWYELRQRVGWLKAEMERGRRLSMQADLVDDAELLAMLENRLENEPQLVTAEFGAKELAELMGVSQARLMRLFRNSTIFRSADEYLENLRLVRVQLRQDPPAKNGGGGRYDSCGIPYHGGEIVLSATDGLTRDRRLSSDRSPVATTSGKRYKKPEVINNK